MELSAIDLTLTVIASILMIVTLILAVLPFIGGGLLMWIICLTYGLLTNFSLLTLPAFAVITGLTLLSVTSDFWLPFLGVKSEGGSCLSAVGMIIGGLIGTFAIPIPLIGTLVGSIAGALLLEILRTGDLKTVLPTTRFAVRTFIIGLATEILFCLAICAVFFSTILIN